MGRRATPGYATRREQLRKPFPPRVTANWTGQTHNVKPDVLVPAVVEVLHRVGTPLRLLNRASIHSLTIVSTTGDIVSAISAYSPIAPVFAV